MVPPVGTGVKLGGNTQTDPRFRKLVETLHKGTEKDEKPAMASAPSAPSGGEPLPLPVQEAIERSLQVDLKPVRVHTDTRAQSMVKSLSARAVTHGSHIFLGPGERTTNLGLMAHEVAHVLQQRSAPTPQRSASGQSGVHEQEADRASEAVLRGEPFRVREQTSGSAYLAKRDISPEPADVTAGSGTVLEVEGLLRALYEEADRAIYQTAQRMLAEGIPEDEVARWANAARNETKLKIRRWDLDVVRLLAEQRNVRRYGSPIGPTYEQLRTGDPARGIAPKTDRQIIESAAKADPKWTKWAGRLRIAGRILIAIDIGIATYRVATAGVEWPRVAVKEAVGLAGAMAGGWGGAKLGGAIGASVGAIPGAAIGAVIGGVVGAIGVGLLGRKGGEALANKLFPPEQTYIEGSFR